MARDPEKYREYRRRYDALTRASAPPCPECGGYKHPQGTRCLKCTHRLRKEVAEQGKEARKVRKRAYYREYMKTYRAVAYSRLRRRPVELKLCRLRWCMYHGYDHHHCVCGLVLSPTENACPVCLAEQPRIEFKVWPKEAA